MIRIALLAALLTTGSGTAAFAQPAIDGTWTFNAEQSTSPEEVTRGRVQGPSQGTGGGFGFGSGGQSEAGRQRALALTRRLREAPKQLIITSVSGGYRISDGGPAWTVTTDGRPITRLTGDGEIKLTARLDGTTLVVQEEFSGGYKLVYEYARATTRNRRLAVEIRVEGNRGGAGPLSVRRVYDEQAAEPSSSTR